MKAIIINNDNALIVDVCSYEKSENGIDLNLRLTVNPSIDIKTNTNNTILLESYEKEKETEVSNSIAESLVGPEGHITHYEPKENKKTKKYIKENK